MPRPSTEAMWSHATVRPSLAGCDRGQRRPARICIVNDPGVVDDCLDERLADVREWVEWHDAAADGSPADTRHACAPAAMIPRCDQKCKRTDRCRAQSVRSALAQESTPSSRFPAAEAGGHRAWAADLCRHNPMSAILERGGRSGSIQRGDV